jgi:hypothetical protein
VPRLKKLEISQGRPGSKRIAGELRADDVELNSIGELNLLNQTEVDFPKVAVETA